MKNYPKTIRPTIRKMEVGEEVAWARERSASIRSTIINYTLSNLKKFSTRSEGNEIIVTRDPDREKNYE